MYLRLFPVSNRFAMRAAVHLRNMKGGAVVFIFASVILLHHFSRAPKIRHVERFVRHTNQATPEVQGNGKAGNNNLRSAVRLFGDDFLEAGVACTQVGPGTFPRCAPGYWCLGVDGSRTCAKQEALGGSCADDPYRCGAQLKCDSTTGKCVDDLFMLGMYLEYGNSCGDAIDNAYQRCKPGLWCIHDVCRKLIPCGGECDGVQFQCRPGLECMNIAQKSVKLCRPVKGATPETVLFGGQTCVPDGETRCKIGLVCVERNSVGTCQRPARLGAACGGDDSDCEKERVCSNEGKCTQIMQAGQVCGDSMYLICDEGLTCTSNKCV